MLLQNYITSAWRNLVKHKLYSAINVLGLAIGLAAVMMITLFVRDELGYDAMWSKADNIYRTDITFSVPGREPMHAAATPGIALPFYRKDFPQIEYSTRVQPMNPSITRDENTIVEGIALVDAEVVDVFDFNVIAGDIRATLADNSSIALNQELATKYFGEEDPINQVLSLDYSGLVRDYKVTAVYEDFPDASTVYMPAFALIDEADWTERQWMFGNWYSVNSMTYLALRDGTDPASITDVFPEFINRNFSAFPMGGDDAKTTDFITMGMMNIQDIHLRDSGLGAGQTGSYSTVMTFAAIAVLILIIASINFMNLSTARASKRAREVSMRKVVGASRAQLIVQFLGESIMITLLGLVIALAIAELALPSFASFMNKELSMDYASLDMLQITGLALFVGLVGGLYPAFILSNFRPASVLKANQSSETSAGSLLRTTLVVIQFAVSIGLFVSTGVIYGQTLYAKTMDVGFNRDNVLIINRVSREGTTEHQASIINELRARNDVFSSVTSVSSAPGSTQENNNIARTEDTPNGEGQLIGQRTVNFEFFKTYQIPIIAGRTYDPDRSDFSPDTETLRANPGLTGTIIVNEAALGLLSLGTPQEAVGKMIFVMAGNGPNDPLQLGLEIIGVVPSVNFDSIKQDIRPEMYQINENLNRMNVILARFKGDPAEATAIAEAMWKDRITDIPFSSSFVDVAMATQYQAEEREAQMLAGFSALAILVACLGLYGLASFTAERRTKEIGIRKVMGARIFDIVKLLIWQFSKPVMIANLIAWPTAYYFMSGWLESFVYRLDNIYIFGLCILAGIVALLIAWGTVAGNAIRVAKTNPIKALRYE